MEELVYWRHPTLPCIKVEEISEGEEYSGPAWMTAARQVYCENGREEYREIGHFDNGAPFLYNSDSRISISHTPGLFVVATLADTPDVRLSEYDDRTALGVDAERKDREQALRLRERFLSQAEMEMIPAEDTERNILAWTVKEAAYKAAFVRGADLRQDVIIERMPKFGPAVAVYDPKEFDYDGTGRGFGEADYGQASVRTPDGETRTFRIYSYLSDDFIVTLAYTEKSARFNKGNPAGRK